MFNLHGRTETGGVLGRCISFDLTWKTSSDFQQKIVSDVGDPKWFNVDIATDSTN